MGGLLSIYAKTSKQASEVIFHYYAHIALHTTTCMVFFMRDIVKNNVEQHKSRLAMSASKDAGFELMEHPSYFKDF